MIIDIESRGYYIGECSQAGETKKELCFPAQHNTIQLARDRWFIIYETRGFRGSDDNRSVVYQVRRDAPDGAVLTEGYLDYADQDWDPLGDGRRPEGDRCYVKLCNHSVAFGVPEGAVMNGKPAPHGGYFAAAWRRNPRIYEPAKNYLWHEREEKLPPQAYRCMWIQFRLNANRDDIEITQPVQPLLQRGCGTMEHPSCHEKLITMNESYVVPVPYNREATEWAYLLHWSAGATEDAGVCTAIKFGWNPVTLRYEWVETGPILDGPGEMGIFEGAISPYRGDWLVSARITPRKDRGTVWFRTGDLFGAAPQPFYSPEIRSNAPRTAFCGPDGITRVFTTDQEASPYHKKIGWDVRMPLQVFEIDPDRDYRVAKVHKIFDSFEEGLPIRLEAGPTAHFCRQVVHSGGRHGLYTYSVRPRALLHESTAGRYKGLAEPEEMAVAGVYCSRVTYDEEYPPAWSFAGF